MSDERPLDEDLASLFKSERGGPGAPAGARDRVAARVAASVAAVPAPTAAAPPTPSAAAVAPTAWHAVHVAAVAAAFVVGAATGVAALLLLRPAPPPSRIAVTPAPGVIAPTAASIDPWSPVAAPSTPAAAPASAAAVPSTSARPMPGGSSIALEQAVLDTARVALGREDGSAALAAADSHARRFPHGQLSEEREAIAIQALVLLHRDTDARARADRFVHTYPNSALMPSIEEAIRSAQPAGEAR